MFYNCFFVRVPIYVFHSIFYRQVKNKYRKLYWNCNRKGTRVIKNNIYIYINKYLNWKDSIFFYIKKSTIELTKH